MDNTDKATPRPWTTGLNIKSIILAANNTIQVAECFPDNPNFKPKSPEANAALIVKAVNRDHAWEPMLEALKAARSAL